jgi:hypothetical protein
MPSLVRRFAWVALALPACGASGIRVVGVMHESTEMRPLQHVPPDAYQQLHVLVRLASEGGKGGQECGATRLEGTSESDDVKNVACVPPDAPNDAARIVRQRLRAYGLQVARDGNEPYDYAVDVLVTGAAPQKPDTMAAKALARLTFTLNERAPATGFYGGVDPATAKAAFAEVARGCGLKDGDLAAFSATATQPMNPEFDMMALAADVVDNAVGCEQLARFFHDAHTRFPRQAPPAPSSDAHP